MNKLEKLKQEMLDARKIYDDFIINNSIELNDIELKKNKYDQYEVNMPTKKFELTDNNILEFNRLHEQMNTTYRAFISEYMKQ